MAVSKRTSSSLLYGFCHLLLSAIITVVHLDTAIMFKVKRVMAHTNLVVGHFLIKYATWLVTLLSVAEHWTSTGWI